ncbi:MAG: hypothetical protein ACHQE6_10645 [Solirubrobacterales bacterium]
MDVIPLSTPSDGAPTATPTCAGCGAPLAPDQRYCLDCGRPCSPVRLAFLDVLQAEHQPAGASLLGGPQVVGYQLPPEPDGLLGSLRRYSGLFGLLAVLLASLLIGLLVGHWLTGGSNPAKQVVEVKGLSGALAAAPAAASGAATGVSTGSGSGSGSSAGHGSSAGSGSSQSHNSAKSEQAEEAQAVKEVKTTKPLPAAHKTSSSKLEKIAHTTGKQHAKEVAALGNEPIETGGH